MKMVKKIVSAVLAMATVMIMCAGFGIGAQAATAPTFEISKASSSGNIIVVEFKLKKGGFNALDLQFETTGSAVCKEISFASGIMGVSNVSKGSASMIYPSTPFSEKCAVVTAKFQVGSDYSISAKVLNCAVTQGSENQDVTSSVTVKGSVTSSQSFFARIFGAIGDFFRGIAAFFAGLFK